VNTFFSLDVSHAYDFSFFLSNDRRHARFLTRLQSLTANPTTAVPVIKAATRGYRLGETTARDLISTIWNVMDQKLDHTASIVNAFVDLVDEEEKKQDILASWKTFEIEVCRSVFYKLRG
jgi:E3 ubiquitin-protein ligase ZNF598